MKFKKLYNIFHVHATLLRIFLLLPALLFPGVIWGQTNITSLGSITNPDGHYVITQDITGGTPGVTTFNGILEANIDPTTHMPYRISGLSAPLFTTLTGTVKNLVLEDVNITSGTDVGAIAGTANGAARIYNVGILSGSVGGTGNVGGLVGLLGGTARVINCYSYANITSGGSNSSPKKYVGGLVGNNSQTSTQTDIKTVVVNCMFYGDINTASCVNYAPVYGNTVISNASSSGINPYCYFLGTASFQSGLANTAAYKLSWPADEEYLTRFEYYRSILNSNRQLMAWWATGSVANTGAILKWVLDPSVAKYPILKEWGKYPSIINPDPTRTWDSEANGGNGAWQNRASASPYRGKSLGTLTVTVNPGDHKASGLSSKTIYLDITDMDTLNYDYGYCKVQLPYYNEQFGDPSSNDHTTRYGGNYKDYVVTGWKITSISGGTSGTFTANWESGYNFADRLCTNKDLFSVSGRVFAQGGFFYVPQGVSAITIEAYWGKAVYLHNSGHYLDRVNITAQSGDRKVGDPFAPEGLAALSSTFQGQTVWDAWHTAVTKLGAATTSGSGLNTKLSLSVYDQAIVLLSNFQLKNQNGNVSYSIDSKWHPYTIMSIDQDFDNEPDYCFELQFRGDFSRPNIQPIRFDFLPVPELGMAVRHSEQQNTIGIFVPHGHFEITETSFMHTTQFEYDGALTRIPSPVILNGGHFEQIVVRYGPQNNTQYFLMGGHFRMLRFTPGAHTARKQTAKVRLCAVNAVGGDFSEFYLSGIYRPDIVPESVAKQGNPHCYINGGHFGLIAGAGYDKVLGSITFKIDHAVIGEFYGGGINGANPVGGSIDVTIDHSLVDKYCGGPKVGTMTVGTTVTTHATKTTFGRYYGGGNGGTSYYREQGYDGNDYNTPADSSGWSSIGNAQGAPAGYTQFNPLNTRTGTRVPVAYDASKGYHALYEFECFVESNGLGGKPTLRTYTHWAQFGATSTGDITNVLDSCTVSGNFYGGGNLGNVDGNITSTLNNTVVKGYVCGGGFSGTIEPFRIHDKSTTVFPEIDKAGVMKNGSLSYLQDNGTDRYYTWCYKSPSGKMYPEGVVIPNGVTTTNPTFEYPANSNNWYALTTVSLEDLGTVSGNVTLTIGGNSTIGTLNGSGVLLSGTGDVYGGGDESGVHGTTSVILQGDAHVLGNVFAGGNKGLVTGATTVTIGN